MPEDEQQQASGLRSMVLRRVRTLPPMVRYALIVLLASMIGYAAGQTTLARLADGHFYDLATRLDAPKPPRVIIVEQDAAFFAANADPVEKLRTAAASNSLKAIGFLQVHHDGDGEVSRPTPAIPLVLKARAEKIPAGIGWRFVAGSTDGRKGAILVPALHLPPEYGVRRALLSRVEGESGALPLFEAALAGRDDVARVYLPRMPETQNIPRITASQLVESRFAPDELSGLTAIVAPPGADGIRPIATPLDPAGITTSEALLSAHAVQSLLDRRELVRVSPILSILAILAAALLACWGVAWASRRLGPLVTILLAAAIVLASAGVSLLLLGLLFPLTAPLAAILAAGYGASRIEQRRRDRSLEATVEQAIDLTFSRDLVQDPTRFPGLFVAIPEILGLPKAVILASDAAGASWTLRHAHGAVPEELDLESRESRKLLARLQKSATALPAATLVPGWGPDAAATLLDAGDQSILVVYDVPRGKRRQAVKRLLATAIRRTRMMRDWQHGLLADGGAEPVAIDEKVSNAANLIARQGGALASGLDALDTGVFIFAPLGQPIQANRQMQDLLGLADLPLDQSTLIETLLALTDLERDRALLMVRDILFNGGEMRIPMRDLGARQRVLRLGLYAGEREGSQSVMILEAVDITELDQLAELRLAVGTFIDRQLRNDLEALSLGITLVRDPRLARPALEKTVDRLKAVAARATERLDQVRGLLDDGPMDPKAVFFPIEVRNVVAQAVERASPHAAEMGVAIEAGLPRLSGFSLAEPLMLSDMVEAMIRLIVADTPQDGKVSVSVEESEEATRIAISGGFGLSFDRLCAALEAGPGEVPAEYQIAAAGMAEALQWKATVSYYSSAGGGYRFDISLRRIG